jgi:phage tail sheath protein FI
VPFADGDDGAQIGDLDVVGANFEGDRHGLYALENADLFNLLCIPPFSDTDDVDSATWDEAVAYCVRRRAMVIVDPPASWNDPTDVPGDITNVVTRSPNAALYFPRIRAADPLRENRLRDFAPSGVVAGVIARTDAARGVWKAPAGQEATTLGARELTIRLTDGQNGILNPRGVNCLRTFPAAGRVVWGARTLMGDDDLASQWAYLPVRRTALFIEESLYRGSQWVVFEPNDEKLWAQIRLTLGSFMHGLFRQGAFQGTTPQQAYFVKCDAETTTQADIDRGIVNIIVGFAPLKPAEFVVIQIQQIISQGEV